MRRRGHFWNRLEWDRVEAEVHTMRMDVEATRRRLDGDGDPDGRAWLEKSIGHLERAQALVLSSGGNTNPAWRALHRAREAWVGTLDPQRLRLEADDLHRRAGDLPRGKDDLIRSWVRPVRNASPDQSNSRLREHRVLVMCALYTRNDHWDVHFHTVILQETRVGALVAGLVGLMSLLFLAQLRGHVAVVPATTAGFVATMAVVGAMGGTVTAMMASLKQDEKTLLPYQRAQGPWLVSRPLLGAASALVVVAAVAHGVLGIQVEDPGAYIPLAFVSGFSEVLLLKLVDHMTDGRRKRDEAPPKPPGGGSGIPSTPPDSGGAGVVLKAGSDNASTPPTDGWQSEEEPVVPRE